MPPEKIGKILGKLLKKGESSYPQINYHARIVKSIANLTREVAYKSKYILSSAFVAALLTYAGFVAIDFSTTHSKLKKDFFANVAAGNFAEAGQIISQKMKEGEIQEFGYFVEGIEKGKINEEDVRKYMNSRYPYTKKSNLELKVLGGDENKLSGEISTSLETIKASDGRDFYVFGTEKGDIHFFNEKESRVINTKELRGKFAKSENEHELIFALQNGEVYYISLEAVKKGDSTISYNPTIYFVANLLSKISDIVPCDFDKDGKMEYFVNTEDGKTIGLTRDGLFDFYLNRQYTDKRLLPVRFGDLDNDGNDEILTYDADHVLIYNQRDKSLTKILEDDIGNGVLVANILGDKTPQIIVFGKKRTEILDNRGEILDNRERVIIYTSNEYLSKTYPMLVKSDGKDLVYFTNQNDKLSLFSPLASGEIEIGNSDDLHSRPYIFNLKGEPIVAVGCGPNKKKSSCSLLFSTLKGKHLIDFKDRSYVRSLGIKYNEINGKNYYGIALQDNFIMMGDGWLRIK